MAKWKRFVFYKYLSILIVFLFFLNELRWTMLVSTVSLPLFSAYIAFIFPNVSTSSFNKVPILFLGFFVKDFDLYNLFQRGINFLTSCVIWSSSISISFFNPCIGHGIYSLEVVIESKSSFSDCIYYIFNVWIQFISVTFSELLPIFNRFLVYFLFSNIQFIIMFELELVSLLLF